MVLEFLESIFTKASREARALGYVYETIALKHRHRRRKADWQEHIRRCRKATLESARKARNKNSILILGSGPLLEIPMEELLQEFGKITLLDVVHPREVRAKWGKDARVELIDADLLGIAAGLIGWKGGALPQPAPPDLKSYGADFILSANCLSQLAIKPRQYLEGAVSENTLDLYCESLSAAHLASIKAAGVSHLVIADFESRVTEEDGTVVDRSEPFFDRASLRLLESWDWNLAPAGEFYKRKAIAMTAGAFTIL